MRVRPILALFMLTVLPLLSNAQEQLAEGQSKPEMLSHHPTLKFERWLKIYPFESFDKPDGTVITSPSHLCQVEAARIKAGPREKLGKPVPTDIFLWSSAPPSKPYLTKLGGTPHRESTRPWPQTQDGKPYTFVAQFCFADSRQIVSDRIPDDVMLIFFKDPHSYNANPGDREEVHIEWSPLNLQSPIRAADCPRPGFTVPQLSGVRHRTNEYPDSDDLFFELGDVFPSGYQLSVTQSTKIGRETFIIQNDLRNEGDELICALSSFDPSSEWPLVDQKSLPRERPGPDELYDWGRFRMMFSDVGCMYFVITRDGKVTWFADSY